MAHAAATSTQFLAEAVTLCFGGAVIRSSVGLVAAEVVSQRINVAVVPPADAVLLAAGFSVVIGLAFGLDPTDRAARLDPIAALRTE